MTYHTTKGFLIGGYNMYIDYEYLILNNNDEDNTADECANCPYKGESCNSQCTEVMKVYNPYIIANMSK